MDENIVEDVGSSEELSPPEGFKSSVNSTPPTEEFKPTEESFAKRLDDLLVAKKSKEAFDLITSADNDATVKQDCASLIQTVLNYLTEKRLSRNFEFHNACENILIKIAAISYHTDAALALIEIIDTAKKDHTVVSVLKALQAVLLNAVEVYQLQTPGEGSFHLDWALNSVHGYASALRLSPDLENSLDDEEEQLLEEEDEVRRILSLYIFIIKFYEPILKKIIDIEPPNETHFRDNGYTQRNVLTTFIIQLFGKPLAYLDLSDPATNVRSQNGEALTNVYSRQCSTQLMNHLIALRKNLIELFEYGQRRERWPYVFDRTGKILPQDDFPTEIFMLEGKVETVNMAVMFYAYFVENASKQPIPKVYRSVYLFENGLYYATSLLKSCTEPMHTKGIRLAAKLLENLGDEQIDDDTLELSIHQQFAINLIKMLERTQVRRNSKLGVELLLAYIGKFKTISPKYDLIEDLFGRTQHNKILSLLATIFKNIVADQLNAVDGGLQSEISLYCQGEKLQYFLMNRICVLPQGVDTNIVQNNDLILAALNLLRFLAIRDKKNITKLFDIMDDIEEKFLKPLADALDTSRTEYEEEQTKIREKKEKENIKLEVNVPGKVIDFCQENQLQILINAINTIDLVDSVLKHLNECIESYRAKN